jgi:hypothetical protein
MPTKRGRSTEAELSIAVLEILAEEPGGVASIEAIKKKIPEYFKLTAEDCVQSTTRPNEQIWEQQIRNITSHRGTEGNIIADGLANYVEGGLEITAAGRKRVSKKT